MNVTLKNPDFSCPGFYPWGWRWAGRWRAWTTPATHQIRKEDEHSHISADRILSEYLDCGTHRPQRGHSGRVVRSCAGSEVKSGSPAAKLVAARSVEAGQSLSLGSE